MGPTREVHVITQIASHVGSLTRITVIRTCHELISKFGDLNMHFDSLRTWIALATKFTGGRRILLLKMKLHRRDGFLGSAMVARTLAYLLLVRK